jgi:site-specific recombinase XerD
VPTVLNASDIGQLEVLLTSWRIHLEAGNRSPATVKSYFWAANGLIAFLKAAGMPTEASAIRREHIEAAIVDTLKRRSSSTAATKFRGLQQLFLWLTEEGEIADNPMARMKPPKIDEKPVPVITTEALKKLFATCSGQTFVDRRDTAVFRMLLGSGLRAAEITALSLGDIDLARREVMVMGKGRRVREVKLTPKTVKALDRYLRSRARHPSAEIPALWLGTKGPLTASGITQLLRRRCRQAGIPLLHPHQFRHTFAHLWMSAGQSEHDLAKLAGWNSLQMVGRYASSAAVDRAKEAHSRLNPGDDI